MKKGNVTVIEKNRIFVAIKLIECLYKNGKLPKHIYVNICREYAEYFNTDSKKV